MKANDYIPNALRTAKRFADPEMDMIHAALGLMSEAGELSEVFLAEHTGAPLPNHGTDYHSAKLEELGGFAWFLVYAVTTHGDNIAANTGIRLHPASVVGDPFPLLYAHFATGDRWLNLHDGKLSDLLPWAAGEYGTVIKSCVVYGKPVDYVHLARTLMNAGAALATTATLLGITLQEVFEYNINQLKKRYPDKFTDELAINRLDKQPEPVAQAVTPDLSAAQQNIPTVTDEVVPDVMPASSFASSAQVVSGGGGDFGGGGADASFGSPD